MTYKNTLFNSLNVTKEARTTASVEETALADLMANPDYLRHSSAVINEALKDGYDVLQLPNGDIITTGTRIVTNNYAWDSAKGKLVKARATSEKSRGRKQKDAVQQDAE